MLRNVATKWFWDQRRGIAVWTIAIAVVGVTYASFYPSINSPEMQAALEAYPQGLLDALGMTDITRPAGYLGSTTFGLLGPVLMIIFGAGMGTRAIAGEEESGRLDLLVAHPISRSSLVAQRALSIAMALGVATAALFGAMVAIAEPARLDSVGIENLGAASLQLFLLAMVMSMAGLAVGAATGNRAAAWGGVALVAVGGYLANTMGPSVDAVAWTRNLSPFHYYSGGQPLINGWQPGDAILLASTSLVLVVAAAIAFTRRDVGV
jgi:ABC-2 type transport system permease protein